LIELEYPGYLQLTEEPLPKTISDEITLVENLMYGDHERLLTELETNAKECFGYKTNLLYFHGRADRTLLDLLKRPFTHADLLEETIEIEHPEDIHARARIRALTLVLQGNQRRNITKKRLRQAIFTLPIAATAIIWPTLFKYGITLAAPLGTAQVAEGSPVAALLSAGTFGVVAGGYALGGHFLLRRFLKQMTTVFRDKNRASCKGLVQQMADLNARIRAAFTKLLGTDIAKSQTDMQSILSGNWPAKAKRLFKLALWQAKRIEGIERYWQSQLERIRVFELCSDAAGNLSSHLLAGTISILAAVVGIWTFGLPTATWAVVGGYAGIFAMIALLAHHFGRLTRKPEFSYAMNDIARQGFREWSPFATVRYFDKIAAEFESGKGDFQLNRINPSLLTTRSPAGRDRREDPDKRPN
jgi:hypothetical protein